MKKQTPVDFLKEELNKFVDCAYGDNPYTRYTLKDLYNAFEKAKKMEEKNMVEFAFNFYYDFSNQSNVPFNLISENKSNAEQYYNKTFKSE